MGEEFKVTDEQIQALYTFTRKHYVEHYDLQTELVDHLANAIEKLWQEQPHLSFEKALQIEFKKFGVFGFMEVVEERQKALSKKYSKLIWKHFKEFFKLPRILLTLTTVSLVFLILKSGLMNDIAFAVILLGLFLASLVHLFVIGYRRKKQTKKGRKRWMFEEMLTSAGIGTTFSFMPFYFFNTVYLHSDDFSTLSIGMLWLVSALFVGLLLVMYIMQIEIPKKAQEYLVDTYPEYELVEA